MINYSDEYMARYVVRKVRKDKGFRLKDIEDHHISSSTISNIERGEEVRSDTFDYLLKKIGANRIQLSQLIKEEKNSIAEQQFSLECIESLLELRLNKSAKKQLDLIQIEEFHPLAPFALYLKGFINKHKDWKKASKNFKIALRLIKQHQIELTDNIIPACYNQLSICSFNQNDLEQALKYVNIGLSEYNETLERADIRNSLLSNKILYLMKSSKSDHAAQILNELWESIDLIDQKKVVLDLYKFRSVIFRERDMFEEATAICNEGIQLARITHIQNRHLDLINVMRSILLKQRKSDQALTRFQMVLSMDQEVYFPRRHVDAHTYLGVLHSHQKNRKKSVDHSTQAIEISRSISDIFRLSRALIVRGDILYKQNQWKSSIPYYQEAVELTKKHEFPNRMYTALNRLTRCYDILNMNEEFLNSMKKMFEIQSDLKITSEDEIYDNF